MNPSPWFQRLLPQPGAPLRLFCFHHAGGSAGSFRLWPRSLKEFDVCAVQLPGRANRIMEAPLHDVPSIVDALEPVIRPLLDRPCAFFGHSMGTAIAWGLARRLHESGTALPVHLFVSGRQPPHKPFPEQSLRGLTDAQVVERICSRYGGFPPEALANSELMELLLPTLRADFNTLDAALPAPGEPLPMPITALGGLADPCSAAERLSPWQAYTREPLVTQCFPGNHFYIDERLEEIAAVLRSTLDLRGAPFAARRAA
jgi:medium-chain acyl-[acyl-carrier-protein] hydrolase